MIAVYIALGVVLVLLIYVVVAYNRFVAQRQLITDSWRDIDVELQRRHDLIPNLVATVKGYAAHEKAIFEAVATARANAIQAAGASPADRERAESDVTQRLVGSSRSPRPTPTSRPARTSSSSSTSSATPRTGWPRPVASTTATSATTTPACSRSRRT